MKKIIAVVLAVVLVAGGLGGFAYAQTNGHEPMTGQKLVGTGSLGSQEFPDGNYNGWWTYFRLTNPDGISEINIERISIINGDGTVVYEGPFLKLIRDEDGEVVDEIPMTDPMKPHEIRFINLPNYMPDPEDPDHEWMSTGEARLLRLASYTAEVFWTGSHKKGLPLIGWAYEQHGFLNDEGFPISYETVAAGFGTPMVNMKQVLMPEDND